VLEEGDREGLASDLDAQPVPVLRGVHRHRPYPLFYRCFLEAEEDSGAPSVRTGQSFS
jgi:hypothetical protein